MLCDWRIMQDDWIFSGFLANQFEYHDVIASQWTFVLNMWCGGETYYIHKVHFLGAVHRNKTQFNQKNYWNRYRKRWDIFQHIHIWNWDICHVVGPTFAALCYRRLPPGSAWHSSPPVIPKCWRWLGISWCVRKDGPQLSVLTPCVFFVLWCQLLWHPPGAQFSATRSGKPAENDW